MTGSVVGVRPIMMYDNDRGGHDIINERPLYQAFFKFILGTSLEYIRHLSKISKGGIKRRVRVHARLKKPKMALISEKLSADPSPD